MGPITTDDPQFLQIIGEWLREAGDLLVNLYYPQSGGGGTFYLLRSTHDFKMLVDEAKSNAVISIWRRQQFPLRAVADEDFINHIQDLIRKQIPYKIYAMVSGVFFPEELEFLGESGSASPTEFLEGLRNCIGQTVFVGEEPILPNEYSLPNLDAELLIVRKLPLMI
jgi:hypothetical protein